MEKQQKNLEKIIDVRILSNKNDYLKWIPQPSYMSHMMFDNDLVVIHKSKVTLTLNKPAYVGICILDFSKVLMFEFHYEQIKNKCGNNSRLLFTNTDSLTHEIKNKYVYENFNKDKEMFSFSNYLTK